MDTTRLAMTGDETAAYAMRQIEPDVIAAYPITPQTEIVMTYAQQVADGLVATELIPVESEHSAMSACVGSAASGARTMTATAANGLALMHEVLYIAASTRLPIVMSVVNRALSAPINIHCDHSDSMGSSAAGWIQMYSENPQDVYHNLLAALRTAEHPDIRLPVMVCQDGFITSHATEPVDVFPDDAVKEYVGSYEPERSFLDLENPTTFGPLDLQDYYFEHKRQQSAAISAALETIPRVFAEFEQEFGVQMGMVDAYRMDDAELAIVVLSSTAGTAKTVVDDLRERGTKAGVLRPRVVRPFPADEILRHLAGARAVAVLDRSESFSGQGGPLFTDLRSALYGAGPDGSRVPVVDYIYGLGGREIYPDMIEEVYEQLRTVAESGRADEPVRFLGVRA